ncbi:MAG: hypothetical protein JSU65_07875, partial [Candidatus Zixiibacteriota bacterium]
MSSELSSILVQAGKITQEQADEALELVQEQKKKFADALVEIGAVKSGDDIANFIGKHLKIGALRIGD